MFVSLPHHAAKVAPDAAASMPWNVTPTPLLMFRQRAISAMLRRVGQ